MGFLRKNDFFFKFAKGGIFASMRINWFYFLKCFFSALIMRCFWQKLGKFSMLEKLKFMMKIEYFFERKRFHLFKSLLYKNGKAQNMLVVAGRFVSCCNPVEFPVESLAIGGCGNSYDKSFKTNDIVPTCLQGLRSDG